LQTAYNNSTGGTTPEIKVDSTRGGVDIQDANSTISGSLFTVRASNGSGLGGSIFDVQSTGAISLTPTTAGSTITIGSTTETGTITLGQSTATNSISIGGAAGNGNTQTISIGNSSTAGSTTNTNIGSSVAGTTAITGPTTVTNRTSGSSDTFVASNSTSTGSIAKFNDNATTVFSLADGGAANFKNQTDSASAFQIQSAATSDTLFTANTTNNRVTVGNATASAGTDTTLFVVDSGSTSNLPAGVNGGIVYDSTLNKFKIYENGAYKILCNTTDALCGGNSTTLQQAYTASTGGTTPEIKVDSTRGGVDIQDADSTVAGSLFTVRASNGSGLGSSILDVQSTGAVAITPTTASSTITVGSTTETGTITLGQSTASNTISIGGAAGNGNTQTVNIGNSSTAGSTTNTNIGSSIAGTTAVTGATTITNRTSGSADTLVVSNSSSTGSIVKFQDNATTVFSLADGGAATFQNQTDSTAAFQIQNAAGNDNLFLASTTNSNLVANSSAESTATGWSINTGSGSAPASTTSQALYGNSSLSINTSATATAGAKYDTATLLSTTTTYSLSFWAKIAAGSFTVQAGRADNDTFAGESTCTLSSTSVTTTWTRFTCSFTTATVTTGGYIFIRQSDSTSRTWFVDGVQLEQAAAPTNYREGSLQFNGTVTSPTIFQNQSDTTSAFQIQNASGNNLLLADSSNFNVTVLGGNNGDIQAWQTNSSSGFTAMRDDCTVTANGFLYVLGGVNGAGTTVNTVQYARINANGSVGNWSTTTAINVGGAQNRADAGCTVANGYVYVLGGASSASNATAQSTVYYSKINTDGTLGSWSSTTALPSVKWLNSAVAYNGYIYSIKGDDTGGSTLSDYYAKLNADGTVGAWTTVSTATSAASPNAVVANGYLYVVGAQASSEYAKLGANGAPGAWTSLTSLPEARLAAGVAVSNGYLYIVGGDNATTFRGTTYYGKLNSDGSVSSWNTSAQALPGATTRAYFGNGLLANGYMYVIGGQVAAGGAQSTQYYTSLSRLQVGGNLDLVGLSGDNLNESNSGGSLTAGNTNIIGTLNVQGSGNFRAGVNVGDTLTVGGSTLFKNGIDSAGAFQVQNAAATNLFAIDTSGLKLQVGSSTTDANAVLLILDSYNNSTDPTGTNGAMYYNTNTNAFRCFGDGTWQNCGGLVSANTSIPGGNTISSVGNANTEVNFASNYSLPADYCQPGRVIRVAASGTYGNSGAAAMTLRVKFGTTVIGVTPSTSPNGAVTGPAEWNTYFNIICDTAGSSGTVEGQGYTNFFLANGQDSVTEAMTNSATITINTTTTQTVQMSIVFSAANAGNTITMRQLIIEGLGP
jgi:hypothetical protein